MKSVKSATTATTCTAVRKGAGLEARAVNIAMVAQGMVLKGVDPVGRAAAITSEAAKAVEAMAVPGAVMVAAIPAGVAAVARGRAANTNGKGLLHAALFLCAQGSGDAPRITKEHLFS